MRLWLHHLLQLVCCLALSFAASAQGATFAYVGNRALLTAEFSGVQGATVNLFNLSDYVSVFKAENFLVISDANVLSLGQVFVHEDDFGEGGPYESTKFLEPWSYAGLEIIGTFPAPEHIKEVVVVLGGKRLYLKRSPPDEFEELAARIGSIDFEKKNGAEILQLAAIVPRGRIKYPSGEQDELDLALRKILGPNDINPPRVLVKKPIQLTRKAREAGVTGQVRLKVALSRFGEVKDVKVLRGLGYGLDERAVAVVKNSWEFLPATKRSELVEVTITIAVEVMSPSGSSQENRVRPSGLLAEYEVAFEIGRTSRSAFCHIQADDPFGIEVE